MHFPDDALLLVAARITATVNIRLKNRVMSPLLIRIYAAGNPEDKYLERRKKLNEAASKLYFVGIAILSLTRIDLVLRTPFSQTWWDPLPLEKMPKITSPLENYSPIFAPAEND